MEALTKKNSIHAKLMDILDHEITLQKSIKRLGVKGGKRSDSQITGAIVALLNIQLAFKHEIEKYENNIKQIDQQSDTYKLHRAFFK
jgi:hypothetical protein